MGDENGKDTPIIGVRFARSELQRLDAYAARARRVAPGARWTRSSAIRDLVLRALDTESNTAV